MKSAALQQLLRHTSEGALKAILDNKLTPEERLVAKLTDLRGIPLTQPETAKVIGKGKDTTLAIERSALFKIKTAYELLRDTGKTSNGTPKASAQRPDRVQKARRKGVGSAGDWQSGEGLDGSVDGPDQR